MNKVYRSLLRMSAVVVGLMGIGIEILVDWNLKVSLLLMPWVIILLGYGFFGLFGIATLRSTDKIHKTTETHEHTDPLPRKGLAKSKKIIIGCGSAIFLLICTGAIYFAYTFRDAKTLGIEVNYPNRVEVGDNFELNLNLKNEGDVDFVVQSISLSPAISGDDESILAGAIVSRTEPAMSSIELSLLKMRTYYYNRVVKPGETYTVSFYFQAMKAGGYNTDFDVYLSDSWSTASDILISIAP